VWTTHTAGVPTTKLPPLASSRSFSIKQYNVLSEGMAAGPGCPKRHAGKPDATPNFGGFDSVRYPDACLPFSSRRWGILEEILQGGPDLVTLQEVDHYDSFFAPWMREFGYDGCFKARANSPCIPLGFFSDGCAIFWKRDVWKLLANKSEAGEYHGSNQVYLVQTLMHAPSGRTCVVGTTQLAERCTIACEGLRKRQVAQFLAAMQEAQQQHPDATSVFGADLNAVAYPVRGVAPNTIRRISKWTGSHTTTPTFASAYPLASSKHDGAYTTWTLRGPIETCRVVDYIWYSQQGLQCVGTLDVSPADMMAPERMPSMRYPSHHVPIMACLAFIDA
jgi:mRNA deadenylase 3'-5' endonuclease subunit Ccr4